MKRLLLTLAVFLSLAFVADVASVDAHGVRVRRSHHRSTVRYRQHHVARPYGYHTYPNVYYVPPYIYPRHHHGYGGVYYRGPGVSIGIRF